MENNTHERYLHQATTRKIIGCFYRVYNQLGYGFLEKVYENAFALELGESNLLFAQQSPIDVYYHGVQVGQFAADFVVEQAVILELKAVEKLKNIHKAQLTNYLTATKFEVGLLFNFGPKAEINRVIKTNDRKKQFK